jgi:hypothetical protein
MDKETLKPERIYEDVVLQIIYNENTNEQCNFKFTLFKKYLQIAH